MEKSEKISPNRLSSAGGTELGNDSSRSFRTLVFLFVNGCCCSIASGLWVVFGGDGGDGGVGLEMVLSCWFFLFIIRQDILLENGSGSGSGIVATIDIYLCSKIKLHFNSLKVKLTRLKNSFNK